LFQNFLGERKDVGIRDDLIAAQEAVKDIITWERALELLCASQRVTKLEAARWLILKKADRLLKSYLLIPSIPIVEEHAEAKATAFVTVQPQAGCMGLPAKALRNTSSMP
jgi:hypothetical protein